MGIKQIWDGKDLPPVGCQVYIKLASCGMQIYEVTGYEVRKSVIEAERHLGSFIVNINVRLPGDNSVTNQRFLDEVFPLDYREAI
ncbi:hypothetical protein [Phytobacter diazotrophicus]|uniref:hypothetical protein n=1 Tax=Phytobacter diazotrophicus TaxID=395631 RepID=UPI00293576CD|nr:hypothetical protein [Phytobacter diazotrophicus]MDV2873881.1 hypothetical protein [Phytobacter diazotrophicus]